MVFVGFSMIFDGFCSALHVENHWQSPENPFSQPPEAHFESLFLNGNA